MFSNVCRRCFNKQEKKNMQPSEKIPAGIVEKSTELKSVESIRGVEPGVGHTRTFDVDVKHVSLSDQKGGVRFNVETVPKATTEHKEKITLSRTAYLANIDKGKAKVEAASRHDHENIVSAGGNAFLDACVMAFVQHLPLEIFAPITFGHWLRVPLQSM